MKWRFRLKRALIVVAVLLLAVVAGDLVVPDSCTACNYYPIDSWSYTFCRWFHNCVGGGGW